MRLVIFQTLLKGASAELIQIYRIPQAVCKPVGAVNNITFSVSSKGIQFCIPADILFNHVIDGFCRKSSQGFIVKKAICRHLANLHFQQPAVDDEIAGHVP